MMSIIEQIKTKGFVKQIPGKTRVRFAMLIRKPALCNKVRKQFITFKKDPYKYIESIRDDADLFRVICLMRMMPPKRLIASQGIKHAISTRDPLVLHLLAFYGLPFPEIFTFKPKVLLNNLYTTLAPKLNLFIQLNERLPKLVAVDEIVDYVPAVIKNRTISNIIVEAFKAGKLLTVSCPVRDPDFVLDVIANSPALLSDVDPNIRYALISLAKKMAPGEVDMVPDELMTAMIKAVAAERGLSGHYTDEVPKDPKSFFDSVPSSKQLRLDSIYALINYVYDDILQANEFASMKGSFTTSKLVKFLRETNDTDVIDAVVRTIQEDDEFAKEIKDKFDAIDFVHEITEIEEETREYFDPNLINDFLLKVFDADKLAKELNKEEEFLEYILPYEDPDFYTDPESDKFSKIVDILALTDYNADDATSWLWEYIHSLDDREAAEAIRVSVERAFSLPDSKLRRAVEFAQSLLEYIPHSDFAYSRESFDFLSNDLPFLFDKRIASYVIDNYTARIDTDEIFKSLRLDSADDSWPLFTGAALVSPHGASILRNPEEQDKRFKGVPSIQNLALPVDERELEERVSKLKSHSDLYEYYKEELSFNKGTCFAAYDDGVESFGDRAAFEYDLFTALNGIVESPMDMVTSYDGSEEYDSHDGEYSFYERSGILKQKVACAATINLASAHPNVIETKVRTSLFLRDVLKDLVVGKNVGGIGFISINEVNPLTFEISCARDSKGDIFVASAEEVFMYMRPTLRAIGFNGDAINKVVDEYKSLLNDVAPVYTINYTKKPGMKSLVKYLTPLSGLIGANGIEVPQESITTVKKKKATELQIALSSALGLLPEDYEYLDVIPILRPERAVKAMQVFKSSFYSAVKKTASAASKDVMGKLKIVVSTNPVDLFGMSASFPVSASSCQSIVNTNGTSRIIGNESDAIAMPAIKAGFDVTNDFIITAVQKYGSKTALARFVGTAFISEDTGTSQIYLGEGGNIYGYLPSKETCRDNYHAIDMLQDEVDPSDDFDAAYKEAAVTVSEARAALNVILKFIKKSSYFSETKPTHYTGLYA